MLQFLFVELTSLLAIYLSYLFLNTNIPKESYDFIVNFKFTGEADADGIGLLILLSIP